MKRTSERAKCKVSNNCCRLCRTFPSWDSEFRDRKPSFQLTSNCLTSANAWSARPLKFFVVLLLALRMFVVHIILARAPPSIASTSTQRQNRPSLPIPNFPPPFVTTPKYLPLPLTARKPSSYTRVSIFHRNFLSLNKNTLGTLRRRYIHYLERWSGDWARPQPECFDTTRFF